MLSFFDFYLDGSKPCFLVLMTLTHARWIQQVRYVCVWERQDSGSAKKVAWAVSGDRKRQPSFIAVQRQRHFTI